MNSNEVLKEIHSAAAKKVAVKCAVDGTNKTAVEIGNAIIAYGKAWTEGLSDDGRLSEADVKRISDEFDGIVDKYIPSMDNEAVDIAYEGLNCWLLKLVGIKWRGIKYYLNKWFDLNLA